MQTFSFVSCETAIAIAIDPMKQYECACINCTHFTTAFTGKLVSFYNGAEVQYRIFDTFACALHAMPTQYMNQC